MPRDRYTIGEDLGQSSDPTAIAVVRRVQPDEEIRPIYEVPHLERLPLGTTYPGVIAHTKRLLTRPPLHRAELVIDYTGVGRPVFDMFLASGLSPIGVSITGGDAVSNEGLVWHVAKIVLVSQLQALLHDGRLRILNTLPDATVLKAELQDFKAEVTDLGNWKFGARSGKHDDLVLALAIALWRACGSEVFASWVAYYGREVRRARGEFPPLKAAPLPAVEPPAAVVTVALHAPQPYQTYAPAAGVRYSSDGTGIIVNVDQAHVGPLIDMGCWRILTPASSGSTQLVSPTPGTVRLRGKPHQMYQPVTGTRYTADGNGWFDAAIEHVAGLRRGGCELVTE